ncbi:MAG: hypothetical protein NXI32_01855 [bacterium]|nr:hypothetical protein [bacterium]
MSHLLLYYQRPEPATWVFLSSFLLLSIYFVFHRFFSVRNLDIVLLILLAPGLMMVYEGRRRQLAAEPAISAAALAEVRTERPEVILTAARLTQVQPAEGAGSNTAEASFSGSIGGLQPDDAGNAEVPDAATLGAPSYPRPNDEQVAWPPTRIEFYGFASLLIACALLMIRMLIDPALVRRPLLVPNLTIGGLSFIGISLFLFLMANVVTSSPREQQERGPSLGPGYVLLHMLPALPTTPEDTASDWPVNASAAPKAWLPNVARILAIISNLAIIVGIVGVGYWHFDNVRTGIGCAVMYLLLPYTAQMTGNLEHTVPAAFLVLAILAYRQPMIAGMLLGFAAGLVYYPLFLMPLWISFYWHRGLGRLITGFVISLAVLVILLAFAGSSFTDNISRMFGLWLPRMDGLEGIWASGHGLAADFRIPILVGCILLSASFVFWPPRKNLGSLMCGTAAIMLAVQFWHGFGGGLYMAWFLPFTVLTIFRPNLDDRVATNVVRYAPRSSVADAA